MGNSYRGDNHQAWLSRHDNVREMETLRMVRRVQTDQPSSHHAQNNATRSMTQKAARASVLFLQR